VYNTKIAELFDEIADMLELEGDDKKIDQGIAWVTKKGVRVDPVIGDVVEG